MTPLVTIGIPCFNNAGWLAKAIESALAQTWQSVEVIVSDDGSTDDSPAIARSFGDRIQLLTGENRGANHARNQILKHATGGWVQFLDADDYLEPEKIAQQFAEATGGADADVIFSPVWWEYSDGEKVTSRSVHAFDGTRDLVTLWLGWDWFQTGGGLWRKTALERIGGWKEGQPCCQDNELFLRAVQSGLRFVFAPSAHAVYRLWSEDTLCRRDPSRVIEVRTELMDELRRAMREQGRWTAEHERTAGRASFEMSRTLARYDLGHAARYHARRRACGVMQLSGPAAPLHYRVAYSLFGFTNAERIAALAR